MGHCYLEIKAIGDGVSLSVKDTSEWFVVVLTANHCVGELTFAQIDVCHEFGIELRLPGTNQACEDEVVPRGAEEIIAVLFFGEESNLLVSQC